MLEQEGAKRLEKADIRDIFAIPNLFTLLRLSIVVIILASLFIDINSAVIRWLFVIAVVSDKLDGFAARRLKKITKLGESLDPIADNFLVLVGFSYITLKAEFPYWLYFILLVVFFIGFIANLIFRISQGRWFFTWIKGKFIDSKVPIIFGFLVILMYLFSLPGRELILSGGGFVIGALVLVDYFWEMKKSWKKIKKT